MNKSKQMNIWSIKDEVIWTRLKMPKILVLPWPEKRR